MDGLQLQLGEEFYELKFTHLKIAKIEKRYLMIYRDSQKTLRAIMLLLLLIVLDLSEAFLTSHP